MKITVTWKFLPEFPLTAIFALAELTLSLFIVIV
jgi:hypothetical protein